MATNLVNFGAIFHGGSSIDWADAAMLVVTVAGTVVLGKSSVAWLRLPRLTIAGCAAAVAGLLTAYISGRALGLAVPLSDASMLAEYRHEPHGLLIAILVIAGFVPLVEEWLFRGVLLECLLALFPTRAAVIATALLFAILHLTPATVIHHSLLGYVCGRVRIGSGSLWPAIICHSLYNAVVVVVAW